MSGTYMSSHDRNSDVQNGPNLNIPEGLNESAREWFPWNSRAVRKAVMHISVRGRKLTSLLISLVLWTYSPLSHDQ